LLEAEGGPCGPLRRCKAGGPRRSKPQAKGGSNMKRVTLKSLNAKYKGLVTLKRRPDGGITVVRNTDGGISPYHREWKVREIAKILENTYGPVDVHPQDRGFTPRYVWKGRERCIVWRHCGKDAREERMFFKDTNGVWKQVVITACRVCRLKVCNIYG